jgi:nicotinic acid mononucleotide adenylyltransferase
VRERYRNYLQEIMPSPHRLAIAGMMVNDSKWLSIDPWEATRKRAMDTLSLCEHLRETVQNHTYSSPSSSFLKSAMFANMKDFEIKIFYLCKPALIPMLSAAAMKQNNFHVVCVCRPPESEYLRASLGAKWNGVITVVEDEAILDCSMDIITSKEVRDRIKKGANVANLMGGVAEEYLQYHKMGAKMNGEAMWTREELKLPKMKCTYGLIKHGHQKPDADGERETESGSPASMFKAGSSAQVKQYSQVNITSKGAPLMLPPIVKK